MIHARSSEARKSNRIRTEVTLCAAEDKPSKSETIERYRQAVKRAKQQAL